MRRKGFTLVELLGVIALLAIIGVIAGTSVLTIMSKQKENLANMAENNIRESAVSYFLNKKKIYMPACMTNSTTYKTFVQTDLNKIKTGVDTNSDNKYSAAEVTAFNGSSVNKRVALGESTKVSGSTLDICYNVITVAMLEDAGMIEETEDRCDKNALIVVYSKGDTNNPEGEFTALYDDEMCKA